jgi:hypothetical protein
MNRKEQLLNETLGENHGEQFARLAASRVRGRRLARHLGAAAGVACLMAAAFTFRPQPLVPHTEVPIPSPAPVMEIMSDQELLAQLKDQPVLILKDDNRITGVVFLDAGTKL